MMPSTMGFLTYSEGVNDDMNKFVWSGLGWDPDSGRFSDPSRVGALVHQPEARNRHCRKPCSTSKTIGMAL